MRGNAPVKNDTPNCGRRIYAPVKFIPITTGVYMRLLKSYGSNWGR